VGVDVDVGVGVGVGVCVYVWAGGCIGWYDVYGGMHGACIRRRMEVEQFGGRGGQSAPAKLGV
jgi:hypothetical protein